MNLYFLRHAIAIDKLVWKKSDAERPLTEKGIKKMQQAAKGMKAADITFDCILTSPYRRAYDTAQIVAHVYKQPKKIRLSRSLSPDGDPKMLLRHLAQDFRSWESLLLVGHEPYLSKLIGVLAGNGELRLDFKKGGLCHLTVDTPTYARCATLEWLMTPKLLKQLR